MKAMLIIPIVWTLSGALIWKLVTSWDRLPQRVAVHFNARMQPNRWGSRWALAAIMLLVVLGEAILGTVVLLRVPNGAGAGGMIVLAVNVVMVCAFWQTINYNALGSKFQPLWMFIPLISLLAGMAVFFLLTQVFSYQRR